LLRIPLVPIIYDILVAARPVRFSSLVQRVLSFYYHTRSPPSTPSLTCPDSLCSARCNPHLNAITASQAEEDRHCWQSRSRFVFLAHHPRPAPFFFIFFFFLLLLVCICHSVSIGFLLVRLTRRFPHVAGKSSLAVRYVDGHFVESYYPTIENTFSKEVRYKGQDYSTEIVDTAGQVWMAPTFSPVPCFLAYGVSMAVVVVLPPCACRLASRHSLCLGSPSSCRATPLTSPDCLAG
jgi:hypothetical protein